MSEEHKTQLSVEVNPTQAKDGFAQINAAATESAAGVARSAGAASKAVDGIGSGGEQAAQRLDRQTKSIISSIQRVTAEMQAGSRGTADYYRAIAGQRGIDAGVLDPYLRKLEEVRKQTVTTGASAAQTAAALRSVPAQFTDIFTSLASGQQPLTVLLQQGGQLKDLFGGAGAAAQALGGYVVGLVNPYTLLAAAVGGVAVAYYQGAKEAEAFNRTLILSGNTIGQTTSDLMDMSARVAASSGATRGASADALNQLVASGKVASDVLQHAAESALRLERAGGPAVEEMAKAFAELGKEPLQASIKLNDQYGFLSASLVEQIATLERQGRTTEAARVAQEALASALDQRTPQMEKNLGILESGWRSVKEAVADTWDAMKNIGREDSLTDQAAMAEKRLVAAQKMRANAIARGGEDVDTRFIDGEIQKYTALKAAADAKLRVERDAAEVAKRAGEQARAEAEWQKEAARYLTDRQRLEADIQRVRTNGLAAGRSEAEIQQRINTLRAEYADKHKPKKEKESEYDKLAGRLADDVAKSYGDAQAAALGLTKAQGDYLALAASPVWASFTDAQKERIRGIYDEISANQLATEAAKEAERVRKEAIRASEQGLEASQRALEQAEQAAAKRHGMAESELADLKAVEIAKRQAQRFAEGASGEELTNLGKQAGVERKRAGVLRQTEAAGMADDVAKQYIKAARDIAKAWSDMGKEVARGLESAFGKQGAAAGGIVQAFTQYQSSQADIAASYQQQIKLSEKLGSEDIKRYATSVKQAETLRTQIGAMGDVAGAAKSLFGERTKGYKALEAAEKAFRVFELASAVQSAMKQIGLIGQVTAAEVAASQMKTSTAITGAAQEVIADTAVGQTKALVAVANQGSGDPYSAFPRIAAMAAIMAGLGFMVSGSASSGASISASRQASAGTGSVLGDASAKSESLTNSIDILSGYTEASLGVESDMLQSLRSIERNIGGLASLVVRQGLVSGGAAASLVEVGFQTDSIGKAIQAAGEFGNKFIFGNFLQGLDSALTRGLSRLFGTKTSVVDAGIVTAPQALGTVLDGGFSAWSYATVEEKKKFLGMTTSTKTSEQLGDLPTEIKDQFGAIITDFAAGISGAADALGMGGDAFIAQLRAFTFDLGHISLNGLSGDQIAEQFDAIFSKLGDDIARYAIPGLDEFQRVGEGLFETLSRVVGEVQGTDIILRRMGTTAEEAFGVVGLASVKAREDLINFSGGFDQLASNLQDYIDGFYTEDERRAVKTRDMQAVFDQLGVAVPTTNAGFRSLVDGLVESGQLATEEGRRTYASLLSVADVFADLYPAADDAAKAIKDLIAELTDTRVDLIDRYSTDDQRVSAAQHVLNDAFGKAGLVVPTTAEAFRALAVSADPATEAGRALIQVLEQAAPAFDVVTSAAQDFASKSADLQIQLLDALGESEAATAARRADILSGLGPVLSALQQQVWAAQDAAALSAQRTDLQIQLLEAEGRTEEATAARRKQVLSGLDPSLAALQQQVWAAQDAAAAQQELARAQEQAAQAAQQAADEAARAMQQIHDVIESALNSLLGTSKSFVEQQRSQAEATLQYAVMVGKMGGAVASVAGLEGAIETASRIDAQDFGSLVDYARERGRIASLLNELEQYTRVDGSHAAGLSYVPFDGYVAELHRGERVLTAREAGAADANAAEIRGLREDINAIGAALAQNTRATARILSRWDGDGMPEERVAQ